MLITNCSMKCKRKLNNENMFTSRTFGNIGKNGVSFNEKKIGNRISAAVVGFNGPLKSHLKNDVSSAVFCFTHAS